jgi:hypothetical protein
VHRFAAIGLERAPAPMQLNGNKKKRKATVDADEEETTTVTAPPATNKRIKGKTAELAKLRTNSPGSTPMEMLASRPGLLMHKVDPSNMGEHSPSAVSYNKSTDPSFGVKGRGHSKLTAGLGIPMVSESHIPTFMFRNPDRTQIVPGKQAHSITTTLRELGGVGEKQSLPMEAVLDKTLATYAPRRFGPGAPRSSVHMMDSPTNPTPMRVGVFAEGGKRQLAEHPVAPFVGQAMINMWARKSAQMGSAAQPGDVLKPAPSPAVQKQWDTLRPAQAPSMSLDEPMTDESTAMTDDEEQTTAMSDEEQTTAMSDETPAPVDEMEDL